MKTEYTEVLDNSMTFPGQFVALLPMLIYSYHAGTSVIVSGGVLG